MEICLNISSNTQSHSTLIENSGDIMSVTAKWLGHAAWQFDYDGKTLLIDPWLENPKAPENPYPNKVDFVLITHGHFDHVGNTLDLVKKFSDVKVVCIFEVSQFLLSKGVPESNVIGMNKGGTAKLENFSVTMVGADHSGGCPGDNGIIPGGAAVGYVVDFTDDVRIYHAGDTNVFSDMAIISELYDPRYAFLPIGGHFTMAPKETAYALDKFLSSVKKVFPMHYGTFPILTGTPDALRQKLKRSDLEIVSTTPGAQYKL